MVRVLLNGAPKTTEARATTETSGEGDVGWELTGPGVKLDDSGEGRGCMRIRMQRGRMGIVKEW